MPIPKSTSVAPSAIHRAAFASANRQATAAKIGRPISRVRTGKPSWFISGRHRPGCGGGKAEQHHQRISIDIAGLQPPANDCACLYHPGGTVRTEPIDRVLIAAFPEE